MHVHYFSNKYVLELLPSIMIQRCGGHYFVYLSWLTESVEISTE